MAGITIQFGKTSPRPLPGGRRSVSDSEAGDMK
jgi:hypothetical protein